MDIDRKAFEVASLVYSVVFAILDQIDDLPGEVAGVISQKVQDIVEQDLREEL